MKTKIAFLFLALCFSSNAFSDYHTYQNGYNDHYDLGKLYATWGLLEESPMIIDGSWVVMVRIRPDYHSYDNLRSQLGALQQKYPEYHEYFQGAREGLYYGFSDHIDPWKPKDGILPKLPDEP